MSDLPERFLEAMQEILGEEYPSFLAAFGDDRHYGLRINTSKVSREEFERIAPFPLTPVPWIPDGYYYEKGSDPAGHPFYAAGLYYLQEPSAMTPASRLPVSPGDRVLDLCAAPGGKATAIGAALKGQGLLAANDINTARARALLRNLELFGIRNSLVLNESPRRLAEIFPGYFDKIMVDAPCSGEGMFRKNPATVQAWMEKGPAYFSSLQKEIILYAADMLKPGGKMFYSTCTFSPLENEGVISWLLDRRPEMRTVPMEDYEGFSPGLTSFRGEDYHPGCRLARRIWPHRMPGEGHFLALLQKEGVEQDGEEGGEEKKDRVYPGGKKQKKGRKKGRADRDQALFGDRDQVAAVKEFLSHLRGWAAEEIRPDHLEFRGDKVYYVVSREEEGKGLRFLRNGVYLGECRKNRFEPSQPFALILSGDTFRPCLDLSGHEEKIKAYLRGESFRFENRPDAGTDPGSTPEKGWVLVLVDGYSLGFGKMTGDLLKNKYPPGWRRRE